ncbi:MAG: EMC3/TMCO1 family protein [Candidatus Micrarchaeia archaeon]
MMLVAIALIAIAALYVVFSVYLQRKLVNPARLREVQETIKTKTKELNELSKSNAGAEVLAQKQKELMPLLNETMKMQFKPMLVILPIFIILYYLLLPLAFHGTVSFFSIKMSYQLFFILFSFAFGIIASIAVSLHDRKMAKAQAALRMSQS